jgi:hypothetical protein
MRYLSDGKEPTLTVIGQNSAKPDLGGMNGTQHARPALKLLRAVVPTLRVISNAALCKWRSQFGGMDASLMTRMKELEDENRRLKRMCAEQRLKVES